MTYKKINECIFNSYLATKRVIIVNKLGKRAK